MAHRGHRKKRKSKAYKSDSDDGSSDSDASNTSSESDSESDSESQSSLSSSSSSANSSSDSDNSDDSGSSDDDNDSDSGSDGFDDSKFPDEDPKKSVEEIREIIRDAKVMKFENAIIEKAGIDNYASIRDCDEKKLKRLGMGYTDRDRLLAKFRAHIDEIIEKNRERYERQKELKRNKTKGKGKKGKSKSSSSKSRSRGKSKSSAKSKRSKSSKSSRSKGSTKGKSSSSKSKSKSKSDKKSKSSSDKKPKIDPDEALRKLDTGWSGKRQAWADYKQHEARVAELMEFYDEIGKKRANGEEHARKLLCSYPGGIEKLVIALDKKYHHIPFGWEELLEEAYKKQEYDGSGSD